MGRKNILMVVGVALALVIAGLGWYYGPTSVKRPTSQVSTKVYTNEKGERWSIPDKAEMQIASADDVFPKFVSVTIDPLKVQVGQTQKMKVVVQDTADIASVVAEIETDNGTTTVPLTRTAVEAVTEADFLNRDYFVKDGVLNILTEENKQFAVPENLKPFLVANIKPSFPNTAKAQGSVLQKYIYEGSWLVRDTHEREYQTVFTATDVLGRSNRVVMAWSDPCSPSRTGDWTVASSQNCDVEDGVNSGNLIVRGSGVVLGLNKTFGWNLGYYVKVESGASIAINSGGRLKQGFVCYFDEDGDGWTEGQVSSWYVLDSCSGSFRTRTASLPSGSGDCADSEGNVYPNNPNYYTSARANGSWDYDCVGGSGGSPDPAPATGQCDTNSGLPCDSISPNGSTGYTSAVACGNSGTYVIDPGSFCGGVSCTTENQANNCAPATQQYTVIGQCDNNSGNVCDSQTPNGVVGWQTSVPSCGNSGTYINNAGNYCGSVSCTTETRTQGCR
ncbi:MAG TPA: hypothetical protein VNK70_00740 [Candidatus Paceibacterota bacterium]|nr:hypothetical protein [Candidatus Paceibacterota bacterium]